MKQLTEAAKREIIELIQLGTDLEEIAAIMRVSIDVVCDINEAL